MTFGPLSTVPVRPIPRRRGGVAAVAFVVVAVVALGVVPFVLGRKAARAQAEFAEVLDPARLLGTRISLVEARQMSWFQAFLLTGDPQYREPYLLALREEQGIIEELQTLVRGMGLQIRGELARLSTASARWHVEHQSVFDSEKARLERVQAFDQERERFEEMQHATLELESAIQAEVDAGRARAEELRTLQTRISVGLLLLGLVATLAVSVGGNRLRTLAREIEERRRTAVRSRKEMDALLDATADGVLGVDRKGVVLSLNRAGAELLGYSEAELEGRDVHDTLYHTTLDGTARLRSESAILQALAAGAKARSGGTDVLQRKDGSALPVQWSIRPLWDGWVVRGGVLTFTDLTEVLRTQEALERAVRIREEVVSVVSHDLRNPLGVVAGAAELLLDLPLEERERKRQAEIIRRSAERMRRLIENLLDVTRIEAGAMVVRAAARSPAEILADVEGFFRSQAEERGVTLACVVPPGLPPVFADPDRTQQALANLVTNALRFSPSGGRVTLGAHLSADGWVALTVEDQGPGIAPEDLPHLFDRFWQASRDNRTGSGLGLAIVRGIAKAHGGRVEVGSELGTGTRFALVLPRAEDAASREVPRP